MFGGMHYLVFALILIIATYIITNFFSNTANYCELPFRSLIATGVDNLMAVGRCCSAEYHALGSIRVIAPSFSMGQAAAYGASLYIDKKLNAIRDLDGKEVRQMMIDNGVALDELPDGYWKKVREFEGEVVVSAGDMCEIRNAKGETPGR